MWTVCTFASDIFIVSVLYTKACTVGRNSQVINLSEHVGPNKVRISEAQLIASDMQLDIYNYVNDLLEQSLLLKRATIFP